MQPMNKYAKNRPPPTLDLHGFRTEEVFDAVEKFLQKHQNQPRVRIMPGKGTGKVKAQVEEYLRLARYHWNFERSDNGQVNDGVMIVFME
jgi:DNA mismatch repair protein MutS2